MKEWGDVRSFSRNCSVTTPPPFFRSIDVPALLFHFPYDHFRYSILCISYAVFFLKKKKGQLYQNPE